MGAGASIPETKEAALEAGYTQEQIDQYVAEQKPDPALVPSQSPPAVSTAGNPATAIVTACVAARVDAAKSLDADAVVALYHPVEGTLLGTVDVDDNGVRCGPERVKEYFVGFLNKDAVEPVFPEMSGEHKGKTFLEHKANTDLISDA